MSGEGEGDLLAELGGGLGEEVGELDEVEKKFFSFGNEVPSDIWDWREEELPPAQHTLEK
jgi:hypothetical protein